MPYSMPLWTILAKWPAPDRAGVHEAGVALGLEGVEGRLHLGDVLRRRRRTSARSRSSGPRPRRRRRSRRSRCPSRRACAALRLVVGPPRVAAVDDEVALVEQVAELLDRLPGRRRRPAPSPRRPSGAAAAATMSSRLRDVARRRGCGRSRRRCARRCAAAVAHVAAHLAEPDESDLHACCLLACGAAGAVAVLAGGQESRRRGISR